MFREPRGLFAEACFYFADHRAVALADTAFAAMADDNPLAAIGNRVRRAGPGCLPGPSCPGPAARAQLLGPAAWAPAPAPTSTSAPGPAGRSPAAARRLLSVLPALAQIAGVDGKLGSPLGRLIFSGGARSKLARAWVQDILRWDFDTVCCGHLTPSVPDGKRQVEQCFSYLLQAGEA